MQYSQENLKTMVYAEFGGQTECIMGNSKIENGEEKRPILGGIPGNSWWESTSSPGLFP